MQIRTTARLDMQRKGLLQAVKKSEAKSVEALQDFAIKIEDLLKRGAEMEREQNQIESLIFDSMKEREGQIKNAYGSTNEWIHQDSSAGFRAWLSSTNGVYWVKGKVILVPLLLIYRLTWARLEVANRLL